MPLKIRFSLTWLPHYIKEGKELQARSYRRSQGGGEQTPSFEMPPMIKRMTTKPIVYSISVSFSIFACISN